MLGESEGVKLSFLEAINTRLLSAFRNLKNLQIREKANLLYNPSILFVKEKCPISGVVT